MRASNSVTNHHIDYLKMRYPGELDIGMGKIGGYDLPLPENKV